MHRIQLYTPEPTNPIYPYRSIQVRGGYKFSSCTRSRYKSTNLLLLRRKGIPFSRQLLDPISGFNWSLCLWSIFHLLKEERNVCAWRAPNWHFELRQLVRSCRKGSKASETKTGRLTFLCFRFLLSSFLGLGFGVGFCRGLGLGVGLDFRLRDGAFRASRGERGRRIGERTRQRDARGGGGARDASGEEERESVEHGWTEKQSATSGASPTGGHMPCHNGSSGLSHG